MSKFNQAEYEQLCDTVDWFFNHGMDFAHSYVISAHILPDMSPEHLLDHVQEVLAKSYPEMVAQGWHAVQKDKYRIRIQQQQ